MTINFEQHCQEANKFINELSRSLGYEDNKSHAALVLRSVMHALRDRITISESIHLLAQLPLFLKGLYVDGWKYREKPEKIKSLKEFLVKVNEDQSRYSENADFYKYIIDEKTIRIVINALGAYVSKGVLNGIVSQLPSDLKTLIAA